VQGLKQEVLHSQKHFVNYVQKFVMLVQPNAKNYQPTIVVNYVQQLAENVLKHAPLCKSSIGKAALKLPYFIAYN